MHDTTTAVYAEIHFQITSKLNICMILVQSFTSTVFMLIF